MRSARRLRSACARLVRRAGLALLRRTSEFRGFSDLFIPPYATAIDWQSGLGDAAFLLYGLVRAMRPAVVVEIGSARGRSTCALALACRHNRHGKVYAIDPHTLNPWTEIGTEGITEAFLRSRLRAYGLYEWCEVMTTTSGEAAKTWSQKVDLLFIDGDHSFDGVRLDFESFRPWLAPGAMVVFHDTAWAHYAAQPGDLEDLREKLARMGVPRYLAGLQRSGYHSVTLGQVPGLTLLDPNPGGFAFLPTEGST